MCPVSNFKKVKVVMEKQMKNKNPSIKNNLIKNY